MVSCIRIIDEAARVCATSWREVQNSGVSLRYWDVFSVGKILAGDSNL